MYAWRDAFLKGQRQNACLIIVDNALISEPGIVRILDSNQGDEDDIKSAADLSWCTCTVSFACVYSHDSPLRDITASILKIEYDIKALRPEYITLNQRTRDRRPGLFVCDSHSSHHSLHCSQPHCI
jgi:hypothetical protein